MKLKSKKSRKFPPNPSTINFNYHFGIKKYQTKQKQNLIINSQTKNRPKKMWPYKTWESWAVTEFFLKYSNVFSWCFSGVQLSPGIMWNCIRKRLIDMLRCVRRQCRDFWIVWRTVIGSSECLGWFWIFCYLMGYLWPFILGTYFSSKPHLCQSWPSACTT